MTEQQAIARAEQMLHQTAAALTPRPRLEADRPGSYTGPCLINPNDTADTRVQVTRAFWLRGISPRDNAGIGDQVLRFWKEHGYDVYQTQGVGTSAPNVFAHTPGDNFLISLEWSADGSLSIGATSPCLWRDGTAPPGT
jgi:hypothetical protein